MSSTKVRLVGAAILVATVSLTNAETPQNNDDGEAAAELGRVISNEVLGTSLPNEKTGEERARDWVRAKGAEAAKPDASPKESTPAPAPAASPTDAAPAAQPQAEHAHPKERGEPHDRGDSHDLGSPRGGGERNDAPHNDTISRTA